MRACTLTALAALFGAATMAAAVAQQSAEATASATLVGKDGKTVGKADLRETPHGVLMHLSLEGLPPGEKALHIHENGNCDPADGFASAGGHFNPSGAEHGYLAAGGPHAGDLPSQWAGENGKLEATVFAPMATLAAGDANAGEGRFAIAGGDTKTAIVLHEKADDYASQPSGDAGGRLACGVIEPAPSSGG